MPDIDSIDIQALFSRNDMVSSVLVSVFHDIMYVIYYLMSNILYLLLKIALDYQRNRARNSPTCRQEDRGQECPRYTANRLQFPFHDSRGSFLCEDQCRAVYRCRARGWLSRSAHGVPDDCAA